MTARRIKFDIRRATLPLLAALAVLVFVNLAIYFGLVRPSVLEWRALNEENSPRAQELAKREASVETFEAYVEGLKQARQDLEELGKVLGTRDTQLVKVQQGLAQIVEGVNVDLNSVAYDHPVLSEEGLLVTKMVVPLEGGYAALRTLLNNVEQSPLFYVVERVTIGQGQDGGVLLQLNVTISTYFTVPEELKPKPKPRQPRPQGRNRRA